MTTRTQNCPVDGISLDNHTELDMIECEHELRTSGRVTLPDPQTKVPKLHESWNYTLPKRYQA
jgi:hypothetical protein